jgi:hypothetical protein
MTGIRLTRLWVPRAGRGFTLAAAATIAAIAATSGVALAYWSATGAGSGTNTAATMTINVTGLQAGDSNQTSLLPGGSADVILRVNNPNAFSVQVSSIAANGTAVASNNCAPTDVTFDAPSDYTPAQFTLAPGSHLIRIAGAARMGLASSSACQGATFSLPISVTVRK